MELKLSREEFRYLADLVYIGNWVLNAMRGEDRISEYDEVLRLVFERAAEVGMPELVSPDGVGEPSKEYVEGGIHEAIMDYEDSVFLNILSEELARRDFSTMSGEADDAEAEGLIRNRADEYIKEFTEHGIDNVFVEGC